MHAMKQIDDGDEFRVSHVALAVGWGFLTALAFIGDVHRFTNHRRPNRPNDGQSEIQAVDQLQQPYPPSSSASSTTFQNCPELSSMEKKKRRQEELEYESILSYGNSMEERSVVGFFTVIPCGLFFGASCILTFCGSKGRVAGTALGLSVLWIWAFQYSTFWHPRWM